MAFRKILVPLQGRDRDRSALDLAMKVANEFSGHVTGLFVRPSIADLLPLIGLNHAPTATQAVIEAAQKSADDAESHCRSVLIAACKDANVPMVSDPAANFTASAQFKIVKGRFAPAVEIEARLSDLVVFSALEAHDPISLRVAAEGALLSGGRPVVYAPARASASFAHRIAVAFDGSAAASHSVSAALPLLARASSIDLFEIKDSSTSYSHLPALGEYLALHGITANQHRIDAVHPDVGESIIRSATVTNCDMLVMGAYGHSRVREFVLGGVTRHILSTEPPFPIFMAH